MFASIKSIASASSSRAKEVKPESIRTLSAQETEIVSGGFNPQPEPPGDLPLKFGINFVNVGALRAYGEGGGAGRS